MDNREKFRAHIAVSFNSGMFCARQWKIHNFPSKVSIPMSVYHSFSLPGMIRTRLWTLGWRSLISCALLLCGKAYQWRQSLYVTTFCNIIIFISFIMEFIRFKFNFIKRTNSIWLISSCQLLFQLISLNILWPVKMLQWDSFFFLLFLPNKLHLSFNSIKRWLIEDKFVLRTPNFWLNCHLYRTEFFLYWKSTLQMNFRFFFSGNYKKTMGGHFILW